jgi:hypothetical protein
MELKTMITENNLTSKHSVEIGIFEIRRHIPILYTFSRICKTSSTNVTIFTTKELYLRLETYLTEKDKKNYDIILKEDNETFRSFVKRVETICNKKIDIMFINTIHETLLDLVCYLGFNPKSKTILLIHHVNAWLKPRLIFNIKHPIRTADTNLASMLIRRFIFPKFDAINVIYHPLKEYIRANTNYEKEIFTLPTSIFENTKTMKRREDEGKLKIVIPGLIQEHRKDYGAVFPAFEALFKHRKEKVKLCVPGLPVGKFGRQIYNKFKDMEQKGCDVEIFDHFVPDDTFDDILTQSDIILAPIRIKTRADGGIEEIYGKTVGSGVVFNAIQYAKPIIVPAGFNMLPELESSTLKYSDSIELEHVIKKLISNPEKLQGLKREALINSQKFSLKNLQYYFEKNILTWLGGR